MPLASLPCARTQEGCSSFYQKCAFASVFMHLRVYVHFCSFMCFMCTEPQSLKRRCDLQLLETFLCSVLSLSSSLAECHCSNCSISTEGKA